MGERLLYIPSCKSPIPVSGNARPSAPTQMYAILAATKLVPAYSEMEVMASIPIIAQENHMCLKQLTQKLL